MAQRQRTRRVDTEPVQGKGSFVVVKVITVAEAKLVMQAAQEAERRQRELDTARLQAEGKLKQAREQVEQNGEGNLTKIEAHLVAAEQELAAAAADANRIANAALSERVLEWDWVDDEGNPLPKPHNNPDVFDLLTAAEIQVIMDGLNGETQKKVTKLR